MNKTIKILLMVTLTSCEKIREETPVRSEKSSLTPFQLTVTGFDYSLAYGLDYVLTEKNLKILFKGELENEQDSVIFRKNLRRNETLRNL